MCCLPLIRYTKFRLAPIMRHKMRHNEGNLALGIMHKIMGIIPIVQASMSITSTMITIRWISLIPTVMILAVSVVLILKKVKDRVLIYLHWSDCKSASCLNFTKA